MVPLTPAAALAELVARLGASPDRSVNIGAAELRQWPAEAATALKAHGVLRSGKPGDSAVCPGCEYACVMPVEQRMRAGRAAALFIVCDKRDDINRVPLEAVHLERWRADFRTLGDALATLLGGGECQPSVADPTVLRLGVVAGRANKATAHLRIDVQGQVLLDVAGHTPELGMVLSLKGRQLVLDLRHLQRCVDAPVGGVAAASEKPEDRRQRLSDLAERARKRSPRKFLQEVADKEGISVYALKQVIYRSKPPPTAHGALASMARDLGRPVPKKRKTKR